ncbi:GNAT family N-acetyltransferase [Ferruginibacter paludis]|uniref:GNAT family N-acetyltransferase n=1 Tax=Ferruginibacter paludis TaxID=1310417 RepID=UPI0025B2B50E|nr:GNAT family N-acetyltransferase [Ferruginibacter paludis]MDN3656024.1 GNAT family N-acetyltransferase [Ferruginibacter paludis]
MEIAIIQYEQQFAADFKKLNLEWLDKYSLTEEADLKVLNDPEKEILATGGCIFLAKAGGEIVGSCALIPEGQDEYELAKMAVAPAFQGNGISKMLLEKCLDEAVNKKAKRIFLLSNSQLNTAVSLYEKYGFRHIPVTGSHYVTADVMMEKIL